MSSPSEPVEFHPEQMQRYLPFKLYNELILNPGPDISKQCVEHLTTLLQTVQTYCAAPILAEAKPDPHSVQGKWRECTLLFADISGFTAMSERLSARGRAGAEEITHIVNAYFTAMVSILHQNGGALIKFGGDALLGLFEGRAEDTGGQAQAARHAVQAALEMQRAMVQFAEVDTSTGCFELQMKVGLHTGRVFTAYVGTPSQMEYWVTGDNVNHTALAEESAQKGQIVISKATRQHLGGWIDSEPLPDHPAFYHVPTAQIREVKPQPVSRDFSSQDMSRLTQRLDTLAPYLPAGLLPRLVHNPHSRRVEGEHRLAAVLFVNIVGFSELTTALAFRPPTPLAAPTPGASQLGRADTLTETMQDYFATMQSIVGEHGGMVNKTDLYPTGDKLLAIFGAPVAHEDDVDQAARAAVAMQAALEGVNQRLVARCPGANVHLRQRIGLSTGYVFSGNVGSESRQEYTIMGDEVNLGARLMSAAPLDQILISEHIFYWLESFGKFTYGGTLSLKGKSKAVPVYRLEHMGETDRPRLPLVDREQALETLRGRLDQLLQGQGQIVSLVGEPGIGKSRLLTELRPAAEAEAVLWLSGDCRDPQPTYRLIAEVLRDYLKLEPADDPQTQRRVLVQRIEDLFGPDQVVEKGPFLAIVMDLPLVVEWKERVDYLGKHLSARLAREVAEFFERLTWDQPLVLVCDDLHWLDEGSVGILLELMELVEYAPIMLGFTLRPGQYPAYGRVSGAAMTQFSDWHTQIRLKPLSVDDSARLVGAILGQAATPEFQERVYQRSQGNPLFIGEIARTAITAPEVSIPDRVQKIIESRVDALPERPRRTIKAAAVVGSQFTLPELVHVLGERERDVRRDLAALRRMRQVDIREKKCEFVNPLTWEVIYNGQSDRVRRASHRKLGDYWAEQSNPHKAADHYFAAEVWDRALEQGERAADQRREAYANQEAIRLYRQALKAAEELEDLEAQCRLYRQLGRVYFRSGDYERAAQAHQWELECSPSGSAGALAQAEAHCALGRIYDQWGKYERALNELDRGLKLAGSAASVTRAQLLVTRCSVLTNSGKLAEAEQDGLQALQIAQDLGARLEEAYACNNLGAAYGTRGQYELALEYHQRSLTVRRELGVAYGIGQSLLNVATAFSYLGKFGEAEACYQEAVELQKHIGDRRYEGHAYHNLAWNHWEQGEQKVAEAEFLRALALWEEIDHRRGVVFVHNDLGTLYLEQGRLDEAQEHLERSARLYEALGANTYLPENYIALAQVYRGLDQPQETLAAAQKALNWAIQNGDRRQEAMASRALGEVHLARANLDAAQRYAQRSLDSAQAEPALPDQVSAAMELLEKIEFKSKVI
jgi:class 3 adenylate cyclase/tetratricopeptide (TPR) repeat protein